MKCHYTDGNVKLVKALLKFSEVLETTRRAQSQTKYRKVLSVEILREDTTLKGRSRAKLTLLKGQAGRVEKVNGSS